MAFKNQEIKFRKTIIHQKLQEETKIIPKYNSSKFKFYKTNNNNFENSKNTERIVKRKGKKFVVHIRLGCNNTFVTLTKKTGEVLYSLSAGKLQLRSSKRSFKYIYKIVLSKFLKGTKKKYLFRKRKDQKKGLIEFRITAPKRLRQRVFRRAKRIARKTKNKSRIIIRRLLPYNGCRAPKMRRKKRQGLRIFKM